MQLTSGVLLKAIRENVFNLSIRDFSEKIYISYSTYYNYEKDKFGKNELQMINELSEGIAPLINTEVMRTKLKYIVEDLFKNSVFGGSQDYVFIISRSLDSEVSIKEFLRAIFLLTYNEEYTKLRIITENPYHAQRRYCTNKVISIQNPSKIVLYSITQTYHMALQIAHDNPNIDFDIIIDDSLDLEDMICNKCNDVGIKNVKLYNEPIYQYMSKNGLSDFFLSYYSLHHASDSSKIKVLQEVYNFLPKNGVVTITDPFFDEGDKEAGYKRFNERWTMITDERLCNKFWISLGNLSPENVKYSMDYAVKSEQSEKQLGEKILSGEDSYMVTREWMQKTGEEIGYTTLLNFMVNSFTDGMIVFKKSKK